MRRRRARAGAPRSAAPTCGLAGPAALPEPVVAAWDGALRRVAAGEEFRRRLAENGMELLAEDQAAFRSTIAADRRRWGEVIRAANIRAE